VNIIQIIFCHTFQKKIQHMHVHMQEIPELLGSESLRLALRRNSHASSSGRNFELGSYLNLN